MPAPATTGLLTAPYVTVPEFRACPTWLDTDDLIPGGGAAQQDAELYNVLLRASVRADGRCGQRLGAHTATERLRARINNRGVLSLHPSNNPVRAEGITGLAYGPDPGSLTAVSDLSGVWVEDGKQVLLTAAIRGNFSGLEFGPPAGRGGEVYVRLDYVPGYASTALAVPGLLAATSVTVADPTGIRAGDVLRVWDPGKEEAVVVAAGYVAGSAVVPLVGPLTVAHAAGAGLSALPADVHQAVICYAVAALLREDKNTGDTFGGSAYGPEARRDEGASRGAGLITEANGLLRNYRRIR